MKKEKGKLYKSNNEIVLCTGEGKYGNTFSGVVVYVEKTALKGVYDEHHSFSEHEIGFYSDKWSDKFFLPFEGVVKMINEVTGREYYVLGHDGIQSGSKMAYRREPITNFKLEAQSDSIEQAIATIDMGCQSSSTLSPVEATYVGDIKNVPPKEYAFMAEPFLDCDFDNIEKKEK